MNLKYNFCNWPRLTKIHFSFPKKRKNFDSSIRTWVKRATDAIPAQPVAI